MARIHHQTLDKTVEVPDGSSLNTQGRELDVSMPCKQMSCGSCIFRVLHGQENLNQPGPREQHKLLQKRAPDDARMMCGTSIQSGEVTIAKFESTPDALAELRVPEPTADGDHVLSCSDCPPNGEVPPANGAVQHSRSQISI